MYLPSPQFSRLVTAVASHLANPALDSMILAWDHVVIRYLDRIAHLDSVVGKIQSIQLLAVRDAVHSILDPGYGYIFRGPASGGTLDAALAAAAQASHDILVAVFEDPADRADLDHSLQESLSLIADGAEKEAGVVTGAESAAAYTRSFGPLALDSLLADMRATHARGRRVGRPAASFREERLAPSRSAPSAWRRTA